MLGQLLLGPLPQLPRQLRVSRVLGPSILCGSRDIVRSSFGLFARRGWKDFGVSIALSRAVSEC